MKPSSNLEDIDVRGFISLNLNSLHFFGYFSPRFEKNSKTKIFYQIYQILFVGFAFFLHFLSQTIKLIVSSSDMEKITDASFLLLTYVVQCVKICVFTTHRSKIWKLIDDMNRNIFKPQNVQQRKILSDGISMSRKITIQFFIAVMLTCVFWGISPLLDRESDRLRLPLSGWYPFNTEKSPGFEIAYVYQCVVTCINGFANISMDTFMSGAIMVVSDQLSILNNSLENMHLNFKKDVDKGCKDVDGMNKNLIRNIIHHRKILEFANDVTFLFTTCLTGMFVVGVIIICISMFQMSLVPVLSFRFLGMFLYQVCVLEEIFLWCYYGNEVILKSNHLTQSAYMCEWKDGEMNFKRNLIYFMTRTQIPLKLYASGYFTLSLDTFKAIVKSSWSYFAVLNQVHYQESQ